MEMMRILWRMIRVKILRSQEVDLVGMVAGID